MYVRQANFLLGGLVFVLELALVGIHHHGAVVGGHQIFVSPRLKGLSNTLDLPRGSRATGVPVLPGDVHFQKRFDLRGEKFSDSRHVHGSGHVRHGRLGRGGHHGNGRTAGTGLAARPCFVVWLSRARVKGSH